MVRHSQPRHEEPQNGYRVELPRSYDAIGVVLRDAYERDLDLPEDMRSLLRQLNSPATSRDNR
jgi:hypothetical protein